MSIFEPMTVRCPACQEMLSLTAVQSVNADRRPDLREAILARTFQIESCPHCKERFRLAPAFNYLDVGRGQWLCVQAMDQLKSWIAIEDESLDTFAQAYGSAAPGPAREIGEALRPRLVFGWAALREKLIAAELGLDDVTLELLKLALIQGLGDVPLRPGVELRLDGLEADGAMTLEWIRAETDQVVERMHVPRAMYEGIANDPGPWAALRQSLDGGAAFIDMQKLYLGPGRASA